MPIRVAQYARMSTESQSYSIANQKQALARYALQNGYEIIRSYEDPGISGLSLKRRRGLRQLLRDVLARNAPFEKILVFDVSRWGRFQDVDEAAHYEFLCRRAGIQVIYCAEPFTNDGTITSDLMKAIKRTMAGEYSRDLSVKVAAGQKRLASLGFWMHSRAPYGMRRMLVSPTGQRKGVLSPGEHKFKSDRVILVAGPKEETAIVREIYEGFIKQHGSNSFTRIAEALNSRGLRYSTGAEWNRNDVRRLLTNPVYAGINVWGRRTKRLDGKIVQNRRGEWAACPSAFEPILPPRVFEKVQTLIANRWHRKTDAELLSTLKTLYQKHGHLNRDLMLHSKVGGPSTYASRFGSLIEAYRQVGYEPPKATVLSNDAQRATWAEVQSLATRICAMFPSLITITRSKECEHPTLRMNTGETISIRTCRAQQSPSGRPLWRASTWQRRSSANLVLLSLFNSTNRELITFYLVRSSLIPERFYKFRKEHPLLKRAAKLPDLFRFYDTAQELLRNPSPV
jgi:DNA invertase Pin-like site-specific DNA recombinase